MLTVAHSMYVLPYAHSSTHSLTPPTHPIPAADDRSEWIARNQTPARFGAAAVLVGTAQSLTESGGGGGVGGVGGELRGRSEHGFNT
jgi:hypothetical protein